MACFGYYRIFLGLVFCALLTTKMMIDASIPFIWLALESNDTSPDLPVVPTEIQSLAAGLGRMSKFVAVLGSILMQLEFTSPFSEERFRIGPKRFTVAFSFIYFTAACFFPIITTMKPVLLIPACIIMSISVSFQKVAYMGVIKLWIPANENTIFFCLKLSGRALGEIVNFFLSSSLIKYALDNPLTLNYLYGGFGLLASFLVLFCASNSPEENRFVSQEELEYILKERLAKRKEKSRSILESLRLLWRILKNWSSIMYLVAYASVQCTFIFMTFGTAKILHHKGFSLHASGTLTGWQWVISFFCNLLASGVIDFARHHHVSSAVAKKSCFAFSTLVECIGFFMLIFGSENNMFANIFAVCLIGAGCGLMMPVNSISHDLTPQHLPLLDAFTRVPNGILPGILAALLEAETLQEEWYRGINAVLLGLVIYKVMVTIGLVVIGDCDRLECDKEEEEEVEKLVCDETTNMVAQ